MRTLALLSLALLAAASAADLQATSRIDAVTVYQSSARVVRTARVEAPAGDTRLLLRGLPDRLVDDSVRVQGSGTARARVHGVSLERVTAEAAASAEVRAAEERLEKLSDEDRALEDRDKAARARREFVESLRSTYSEERAKNLAVRGVSAREWAELVGFVAREGEAATQEVRRTETARRDLMIAWITLKYTQSNSVCFVVDGQAIGVGAGQQSRVHCVRLAGHKADLWRLRQHPQVLDPAVQAGIGRPERDNAIDQFLRHDLSEPEKAALAGLFTKPAGQLSAAEKRAWIGGQTGVALGSDAFFPFRDSIDRAAASGVKYVLEPGGSARDQEVIAAATEYGMTVVFSGVRLFHH